MFANATDSSMLEYYANQSVLAGAQEANKQTDGWFNNFMDMFFAGHDEKKRDMDFFDNYYIGSNSDGSYYNACNE